MKTSKIIFTSFVILISFGCKKDPMVYEDVDINIVLQSGDSYEYDFITGDEEGAIIQIQATHYYQSEIIRSQSTNMSSVYLFNPLSGYIGTDFVQIQKQMYDLSTGEEKQQLYRFNFTIE